MAFLSRPDSSGGIVDDRRLGRQGRTLPGVRKTLRRYTRAGTGETHLRNTAFPILDIVSDDDYLIVAMGRTTTITFPPSASRTTRWSPTAMSVFIAESVSRSIPWGASFSEGRRESVRRTSCGYRISRTGSSERGMTAPITETILPHPRLISSRRETGRGQFRDDLPIFQP